MLERRLLRENGGAAGEPDLADRYSEMNLQYFDGRLRAVPVCWEPRLADVGPLVGPDIVLYGLTNGSVILLNPAMSTDSDEFAATLAHEMVHVSLMQAGNEWENHGAVFQAALSLLFSKGAFKGIPATTEERSELRDFIRREWSTIDADRAQIESANSGLRLESEQLASEIDSFNSRMKEANARQQGWPAATERAALEDRERVLRARFEEHKDRVGRFNAAVDRYNDAVRRYRLMHLYPDGLDAEAQAVQAVDPVSLQSLPR